MLARRLQPRAAKGCRNTMKSAVCLVVRNEARDIAEWIAFHALLGFDTQIILDNESEDGTADIIKSASAFADIRYHSWPDRTARSQLAAYDAACMAYKAEFDWMAFIDSDEFIVLEAAESINSFLARFDGWSGIGLHWAMYGSSGHDDFPPGLVVENFCRRADADFFPARHIKSVIRPQVAERCVNPHFFDLLPGPRGTYCNAVGEALEWWPTPEHGGTLRGLSAAPPVYAGARLNHYFTRSRAHFLAKVKRGYPSDTAVRKVEEFEAYDRNDVHDPAAMRFGEALGKATAMIRGKEGLLF